MMDALFPESLLFDRLPVGAFRTTPEGKQLRANAALVAFNGYASEAEMLAAVDDLNACWYVQPGRRDEFKALMARDGQVRNFVSEVCRHKTGERRWVRETAYVVRDEWDNVLYYEGTLEDITDIHNAAKALTESESRWRLALDSAGDGVWDWHVQSGDEFCSPRLLQMLGFGPGGLLPHASELDGRTHPDDVAQMHCDRDAHFGGQTPSYRNEHRLQCKDGTWLWVLSRGMVVSRDAQGQPLRMIGTLTDITTRKHAESLIWHQAHFDVLTGLPNRRLLRQQLDELMVQAAHQGSALAVVFLDLDRFKEVNDTLGHNVGDALLVEVAHRIQKHMGAGHALARMGGDEFTLVFAQLPAEQDPVAVLQPRLQALLHTLAQPYQLGPDHVFVSASMGVAMYPRDAQLAEDLFRHADQALYAAKGAGRNRVNFFTPGLQAAALRRARLDADLRLALPRGQLSVVYQPIVALDTGHTAKAEALLRWQHPELGAVSPAQFIPVAEVNGQIVPMGDWVFDQATDQVKHWRHLFDANFQISVNKSPVQCHHHVAHGSSWVQRLQDKGLPCDSVAVEITEGLLLDISPQVAKHLADLRDAGMAVSLDDFGTGYSSFTYLQKLAIDFIKIDQSFVRHLAPGSTDLALCTAVIAMANALGMKVVAEGVETEQQRDLLRQAGCHFGQGYLFARPMSPEAFERWMAAGGAQGLCQG